MDDDNDGGRILPIDDAVDFDLRYRQAQIRRTRVQRELMLPLQRQIIASLQSARDRLTWVDETTRKPIE